MASYCITIKDYRCKKIFFNLRFQSPVLYYLCLNFKTKTDNYYQFDTLIKKVVGLWIKI